jgi:hypothetical protein
MVYVCKCVLSGQVCMLHLSSTIVLLMCGKYIYIHTQAHAHAHTHTHTHTHTYIYIYIYALSDHMRMSGKSFIRQLGRVRVRCTWFRDVQEALRH